ncbi:hypothetical protein LINGRAHAP2_LOCUS11093 [Linum grandiflorum]
MMAPPDGGTVEAAESPPVDTRSGDRMVASGHVVDDLSVVVLTPDLEVGAIGVLESPEVTVPMATDPTNPKTAIVTSFKDTLMLHESASPGIRSEFQIDEEVQSMIEIENINGKPMLRPSEKLCSLWAED